MAAIFLVSVFLGFFGYEKIGESFQQSEMDKELEKLTLQFVNNPNYVYIFSSIFLNNFFVSIFIIFLSALFFFFPIIPLISNGVIVGYVLASSSIASGVNPLLIFVLGILPHGILELPAFFVACMMGFRGGLLILKYVLSKGQSEQRELASQQLRDYFQRFSPLLFGLTVFLVIAAAIEGGLIYYFQSVA